ncbi:hypothetical protein [Dactylosporangium sp. CA-092794]|uniref:hypothetical protein n=1 Tax=Dactylosporangium sp. CA-092794 TaxID=3239929 RepID=UPI003D8EACD3
MRHTRSRLLRTVAVPLIGAGLLIGGGACGGPAGPAAPSSATGAPQAEAGGAGGALTETDPQRWKVYDAKGETWAACLREHGLPNVKFRFHLDNAETAIMELDGYDHVTDVNSPALEQCKSLQPTDSDRPKPFMKPYTMDPEQVKQQLALAKCMRENGFPDYPDPVTDSSHPRKPSKYDDNKAGVEQPWSKVMRDCVKQVGIPDSQPGG